MFPFIFMFICIQARLLEGGTLTLCQGPHTPKGPHVMVLYGGDRCNGRWINLSV